MIVSLLLSVAGIGILAGLILRLAIYALPAGVGLIVGLAAYHAGAGPIGGFVVGLGAGALLLALGTVIAETTRSPSLRIVVAAIFAAPAALAGYHLAYRLSGVGGPDEWWRELIAVAGAAAIGGLAWGRLDAPRPGGPGRHERSLLASATLRTDHAGSA